MSLTITRRDLEEAQAYARDALGRARGVSEMGSHAVGAAVKSLETMAGIGAVGALSGKYGPLNLKLGDKQVPLDLAAGLAGHLLALFGGVGAAADHLHNFSDGVLGGYVYRLAFGYGAKSNNKPAMAGPNQPPAVSAGMPHIVAGSMGPAPLTEAELAAMAQAHG